MPKSSNEPTDTRQLLIETGIHLFSRDPGAPFKTLAQEAGVGRATLYRYFQNREQLIEAIALESLQQIRQQVQQLDLESKTALEGLLEVIRTLLPLGERYHFLITLWHEIATLASVVREYEDQMWLVSRLVDRAQQEGDITRELSSQWVSTLIDALLYIGWEQVAAGHMTTEQAIAQAIRSFVHGVAPA